MKPETKFFLAVAAFPAALTAVYCGGAVISDKFGAMWGVAFAMSMLFVVPPLVAAAYFEMRKEK